MFGIDSSEFLVIVIIAVIVIGPKDLPRALYKVGQIVGKAQGMARHFRTGIDAMVREVELEELEKKWAAQNKRIMEEHPPEIAGGSLPSLEGESPPPHLAQSSAADVAAPPAHPPFVAQSAPPQVPTPPAATEGPPYLAALSDPASHKGDAAA
jgi:sec-independent protein translocase protein TatB